MNNLQKRVLAIVIISVGFILIIYAKLFISSVPYPFLTWGLGFLTILAGSALLQKTRGIKEEKSTALANTELEELMTSSHKIVVDLEACEIKENNYQEEIIRQSSTTDDIVDYALMFDSIGSGYTPFTGETTEKVTVNQTVLIYNTTVSGKPVKFLSPVLPFERETLMFKLFAQKQTTIYISETSNKYYFDVKFLFN